ncbi:MAG: YicC/YloC family endoribonuclease [Bernardetiaceae bacterium]
MLDSMTGYGESSLKTENTEVRVTIRTINSKGLDISLQVPERFLGRESSIKAILSQNLNRGRVQCQVRFRTLDAPVQLPYDPELVKYYFHELKKLAHTLGIKSHAQLLNKVLEMPQVRQLPDENTPDEAETEDWYILKEQLETAIWQCLAFRSAEGLQLEEKIAEYLSSIQKINTQIRSLEKERLPLIRQRLQRHLQNYLEEHTADPIRFEQELIYYSEKLDITEEQDRLEAHCKYFLKIMRADSDAPKGKQLGFLAQEIGREINTLGSKANYATIQHLVVQMKEELEKIKEQLLNIV